MRINFDCSDFKQIINGKPEICTCDRHQRRQRNNIRMHARVMKSLEKQREVKRGNR